MVGRLGAVPADPDTTPELAVGLRRTGSRSGDIARALDAGDVFKSYAFRGHANAWCHVKATSAG